jgi:hypothetical protein
VFSGGFGRKLYKAKKGLLFPAVSERVLSAKLPAILRF